MNDEDRLREVAKQYSDIVAINAEGALTPLIYKLDTSLLASYVIKTFVEADTTAQSLLWEYENKTSNLTQTEKEDLWDRFRHSNQIAAVLKQLIEDSKDVIVALPEAIKSSPDRLEEYVEDSRDPEGLKGVIQRWIEDRFQGE